ncbi:hypothetical protein SELMODRAFT_407707 [Selaginella moellendorffii]|uniref:FAF domain-containing protein n=1 Tax=Selaginella moellendorffii TaxID=88036 RepID=D8R6H9_SELML|nr:uncharacterized protein LOC9633727 [Selaginella moellendorffii]EFJ32677.1 hypothetical protein SELMODRAFT_407707 [Selaginella moellendorffii]|eukprot:XP_002966650.1 uncharacterized protein LOC9633727 [Selaginella moellendorffii]
MPLEPLPESMKIFTPPVNAASVVESFGGLKPASRSSEKDVLVKKRGGDEDRTGLVVESLGSYNTKAKDKLTGTSSSPSVYHHHHHHREDSSFLRRRAVESSSGGAAGTSSLEVEDDEEVECRRVVRIFPPPLPSLARKGPSQFPCQMPLVALHPIRSHGRFVLQELKVPKQLMFRPIRTKGRLILQLKYDEDEDGEAEHGLIGGGGGGGESSSGSFGSSDISDAAIKSLSSTSSDSSSLLSTGPGSSSPATSPTSPSLVSAPAPATAPVPAPPPQIIDVFCQGPCGGRKMVVESAAGLEQGTKA